MYIHDILHCGKCTSLAWMLLGSQNGLNYADARLRLVFFSTVTTSSWKEQWEQHKNDQQKEKKTKRKKARKMRNEKKWMKNKIKKDLWRRWRDDSSLRRDRRDWDHGDYGSGGRGGICLLNNSMGKRSGLARALTLTLALSLSRSYTTKTEKYRRAMGMVDLYVCVKCGKSKCVRVWGGHDATSDTHCAWKWQNKCHFGSAHFKHSTHTSRH